MGLDMYIMSSSKNTQKEIELAYWRKANWFHGWFVDELANGEDDCEPIPLKKENLEDLLALINKILDEPNKAHREAMALANLPPTPGFFFGSRAIDDYYWESLQNTKEKLEEIISEVNFITNDVYYQASW